jgi:hypothetical protein
MPQKKIIRVENITEKDILSLYESVVPLLYHNPKKISPAKRIKQWLEEFIPIDFGYFTTATPHIPNDKRFLMVGENLLSSTRHVSTLVPNRSKKKRQTFEEMIEHFYNATIKIQENLYKGKIPPFHYYRLISHGHPKLAVGFFRYKNGNNPFSLREIAMFEFLASHIFPLYRIIVHDMFHSTSLKHFTILNGISQKIAKKYKFTGNEYKFIPDILSGLTNNEIAEKHFVSIPTIKKHLTQIFQKTGTKNRVDFISKFFTSLR